LLIFVVKSELTKERTDQLNIALIATLILPLLYFFKKYYYIDRKSDILIDKYQTIVLMVYFILILVDTSLDLAKVEDSNNYVLYTKIFVLPILVIFSFYSIYQHMNSTSVLPRRLMLLSVLLAMFYYIGLFYSSLELAQRDTTALIFLQIVFSLLICMTFGYNAWITQL
jgi:hypothetical protein